MVCFAQTNISCWFILRDAAHKNASVLQVLTTLHFAVQFHTDGMLERSKPESSPRDHDRRKQTNKNKQKQTTVPWCPSHSGFDAW